jgi:hypothetical protein
MWKYIKAFFTHRPRFYRGTRETYCSNIKGRRIRIWGIAVGPFMLAIHLLDLPNVQSRRIDKVVE